MLPEHIVSQDGLDDRTRATETATHQRDRDDDTDSGTGRPFSASVRADGNRGGAQANFGRDHRTD
jgi:hypothetical protein